MKRFVAISAVSLALNSGYAQEDPPAETTEAKEAVTVVKAQKEERLEQLSAKVEDTEQIKSDLRAALLDVTAAKLAQEKRIQTKQQRAEFRQALIAARVQASEWRSKWRSEYREDLQETAKSLREQGRKLIEEQKSQTEADRPRSGD